MGWAMGLKVEGPVAKLVGPCGQMGRALGLNGQGPGAKWAEP